MKGSYPATFMPSANALFATMPPMAPSPIIPSVFPNNSSPSKLDFPFSTICTTSSSLPFCPCTQFIPCTIFLDEIINDAIASSFTAFALAPGVLNTTIPLSVHLSTGILLTPTPALATAFNLGGNSILFILKLLIKIASGFVISEATSYFSVGNSLKPFDEILFNFCTVYINISSLIYFFKFDHVVY